MSLADQITSKINRQQGMMDYFTRQTKDKTDFMSVDVQRKWGPSEKDKGLITPEINYIEDSDDNPNR